ncbi:class II aldolase/adducin family protein [Paenibacillus sp. YN15]|uniref:class II aldolase/adducin family protein n=1 Tax=Paenibacillus sp. YN15 TaxID=1742774 RepID=UPI000DCC6DD2|nr:class II aldolase/adducin family protein [Paenibacillus sp. YN15]RAV01698.1 class II aldolase/adducin family protein [Paenibacillus sp. YN15]
MTQPVPVREELCKYARKIVEKGMVVGPGGNISARDGDTMLVSPSGFALEEILPEQWVAVSISDGSIQAAPGLRPSSEVLMHLYGYQTNPSIGAMIHTHPANSIAFGLIGEKLPIMFPDQAALTGETGFVPYVVPTTELLANAVKEKINQYSTLLLGNHGLVAVGRNLREAYYRTEVVEESARIYLLAKAAGAPKVLTGEELDEIRALETESYRIKLLQQQ